MGSARKLGLVVGSAGGLLLVAWIAIGTPWRYARDGVEPGEAIAEASRGEEAFPDRASRDRREQAEPPDGAVLETRVAEEPEAVVSGRVLSDVGTPLTGARLRIEGDVPIAEAVSGTGGRYRLDLARLPWGNVTLHCEAPGHRDASIENIAVPGTYDLSMRSAGWQLSGSVLSSPLEMPIPDAVVRLWDERGKQVLEEAATDENGRFDFLRVATGSYGLSAAAAGHRPLFLGVLLGSHEEEHDLTLRLAWTQESRLVRVVESGTSRPIVGARVTGAFGEAYETDEDGAFLCSVPQKAAPLVTIREGFCRTTYLLQPGEENPFIAMEPEQVFAARLSVPADLLPVEVAMEQYLRGGLPARRVASTLSAVGEDELLACSAGLQADLEVGVIVSGPRVRTTSCRAEACPDLSQSGRLPLCVVEAGATLHGRIIDSAGEPLSGATVTFFAADEFARRSRALTPLRAVLESCDRRVVSDSAGHFVMRGLTPGSFDMVATRPGHLVTVHPIQIPSPADVLLVLALRDGEPGSIEGRILSSNGEPLRFATVLAIDPDGFASSVASDRHGSFSFPLLPPAAYKLSVSAWIDDEPRTWKSPDLHHTGIHDLLLGVPWEVR